MYVSVQDLIQSRLPQGDAGRWPDSGVQQSMVVSLHPGHQEGRQVEILCCLNSHTTEDAYPILHFDKYVPRHDVWPHLVLDSGPGKQILTGPRHLLYPLWTVSIYGHALRAM